MSAGVPYPMNVGNHDGPNDYQSFASTFPASRYSGKSWYGGYLGDPTDGINDFGGNRGNLDSYQLFSAGGMDFLVLNLELDSPTSPDARTTSPAGRTRYSTRTRTAGRSSRHMPS